MLSANDIVRATMTWLDTDNSKIQNVWWFRLAGTGTADNQDVFAAANDFMYAYYSNFSPVLHIDFVSWELLVDEVNPNVGPWEVLQNVGYGPLDTGVIQGEDDTNHPLPAGTAALVRLGTLLRKHQGRKYLAGFTEASNDANSRVLATTITAIAAGAADILTATPIPNSALGLQVVVPNMAGFATNEVIYVVTTGIWRSQRRRQPFVGI